MDRSASNMRLPRQVTHYRNKHSANGGGGSGLQVAPFHPLCSPIIVAEVTGCSLSSLLSMYCLTLSSISDIRVTRHPHATQPMLLLKAPNFRPETSESYH